MRVVVVAVGKLRFAPYREAANEYRSRLEHYVTLEERECKASQPPTREADSRLLLAAVPEKALLTLLDERGRSFDSIAFARHLGALLERGRELCFAIGGAPGTSDQLRQRADALLALSPMTFPHELARVVLYEQLYRAMTILKGEPYHK